MKAIEIEILGKKYYFKGDDPDGLKKTAQYLESQLEELNQRFNTVDQKKLFVLYSLIITEKYFAEKENNEKLSSELEQINNLLNNVKLESQI